MDDVVLTEQLSSRGFSPDEIDRRCRRGELHRIRRGAYAEQLSDTVSATANHRRLIWATVPQLRADAVISHTSAAVLHDLPVWAADLTSVHLTRPRHAGGGKKRSLVTLHGNPLEAADVTEIDGIPVTSLGRTVLDLARTLPFDRAVAAGDRALAVGMALDVLDEMLTRGARWHGIANARRLAAFVDGRSQSPGESLSRVRCHDLGLPPPVPQLPIYEDGQLVGYCDFGWEDFRTVGEFDGQVKYQKLLRPGESASEVVVREKRREDRIRRLGWQVVRWIWADLYRFGVVATQLRSAFLTGRI